jgi:hypothetical protein
MKNKTGNTAYIECYPDGRARIKIYNEQGELDYNAPVDEIKVEIDASSVRGVDDRKRVPLISISGGKN